MSLTQQNIERAVEIVARMSLRDQSLNDRGYRPGAEISASDGSILQLAVSDGAITPVRGSWGHRLTAKGREILAQVHARTEARHAALRADGIDPRKALADMTEAEVAAFVAHMTRRAV